MWLSYYAGLYIFVFAIRISALWNEKSRLWIQGRKGWKSDIKKIPSKQHPRIWFHVSSLGEFEQARPVIEKIKEEKPEADIILTFFSPSGYNERHNYRHATVLYLPPDLPGNAAFFIRHIRPDIAVFVKYDLWPGYLRALLKNNIPAILISAHWVPGQSFSSWSFPLTRNLLKRFHQIFLQQGEHLDYFLSKGFKNITVAGDTRIDRSLSLPFEVDQRLPKVFAGHSFDLVAGSTWHDDEELIIHAIKTLDLKVVFAPHDVSPSNIERLTSTFTFPFQLYSQLETDFIRQKVIVIDSIGLLSVLYSVGKLAYVGGGFGPGLHNILEPASHKKPVLFGPGFKKFPEAAEMIQRGGAVSVKNKTELIVALQFLKKPENAIVAGGYAYSYLKDHAGATDIVTHYLLESIPYTLKE